VLSVYGIMRGETVLVLSAGRVFSAPGPPAEWSREALSKTQYPRLALQKSIFAAPFPLKPL
jgi:hypothetical protein